MTLITRKLMFIAYVGALMVYKNIVHALVDFAIFLKLLRLTCLSVSNYVDQNV